MGGDGGYVFDCRATNISQTPGFASNGPHQVGLQAPIGIDYIWAQPAPAFPPPTNYFSSSAAKVYWSGRVLWSVVFFAAGWSLLSGSLH